MSRLLLAVVCPFVLFGLNTWQACHDLFAACGCALFGALAGSYIDMFVLKNDNSIIIDNPLPAWYQLEPLEALDNVKSALLNWQLRGMQWRFLQIEPEIGMLTACLDLFQITDAEGNTLAVPLRRQMVLLAEFDKDNQHTRIRLTWRVRCGAHRKVVNPIVEDVTRCIKARLASSSSSEST